MKKSNIIQFLKFGFIGAFNTIVNYIVYVILVALGAHYIFANAMGFIISVLNAYFWGCRFVFKEDEKKEKRVWWQVLLKTYASYALGFFINLALLVVWVDLLNIGQYFGFVGDIIAYFSGIFTFLPDSMTAKEISEIMGPVLNAFITIPINFVTNKFWAYRQKNKPDNTKV